MTFGKQLVRVAVCACALPAAALLAQDRPTPFLKHWQVGLRIGGSVTPAFKTSTVNVATTAPVANYEYTALSASRRWNAAPSVEYRFAKRFTLGLDLRWAPVKYKQQTTVLSGRPDPNSSYDNRQPSYFTDTTSSSFLEVPVLARAFPIGGNSMFSRIYVLAGPEFRRVMRISTANEYKLADGGASTNGVKDKANSPHQVGWVTGLGFRYTDDFNIKCQPEVRFIHWNGTTFVGQAYRSASNQIEVGVGFSF